MKWPCRECIVRPRCSQECPTYKSFRNYMMNVVSPILLLFSAMIAAGLMLYLSVLNSYHMWTWVFVSSSWLIWIIMQDKGSFMLVFMSPALLPGYIAIRLLAWKYKRA